MMEISNNAIQAESTVRYSEEFNDESAEVTYESSDGVRLRIHAVYLKAHTEGLAPIKGLSLEEVVYLTEPASVLQPLFRFIYPNRPTALSTDLEVEFLKSLAEAAEKYQVFPAMHACFWWMHDTLPNHAPSVLAYALKHDYHADLMNKAALCALDARLPDLMHAIPSEFQGPWLIFYDKWLIAQQRALSTHLSVFKPPPCTTISKLASKLSALRDWKTTIPDTMSCRSWRRAVGVDVEAIPDISDLMGSTPRQIAEVNDGDFAIESSDGVTFFIDLEVLYACSSGFIIPGEGEVKVPEEARIIGLLLRFIKPVHSPNLKDMDFSTLKGLAFAAEKYSIKQATGMCYVFMKKELRRHPRDVFQYAALYRHLDLLDQAAPLVLGNTATFVEVSKLLPPPLMHAWAHYYQLWQDVSRATMVKLLSQEQFTVSTCGGCGESFMEGHLLVTLKKLLEGPQLLLQSDQLFPRNPVCKEAKEPFKECRNIVEKTIGQIPSISSLV